MYTPIREALWTGTTNVFQRLGKTPLIIHSHGNGETPTGSYVVIYLLSVDQTGRVFESTVTDGVVSGSEKFTHQQSFYNINVQFSFYGPEAGALGTLFYNHVNNNRMSRWEWNVNGLSPRSKSNLRYNPQRLDAEWKDAFNMDVTFSCTVHEKVSIDWIEHIGVKANGQETVYIPPLPPTT